MAKANPQLTASVVMLRKQGLTYREIQAKLGVRIPKGTLSYMCRGIVLTPDQLARTQSIMVQKLASISKKRC